MFLTTTGCTKFTDLPPTDCVQIEARISDNTRTSMSGSTASFVSGDNIGVFETLTGRSNVPYAFNGSTWSAASPIYWYNDTSNHSFYAYYPYTATNSGLRVSIPTLSTQTITTAPGATWDLLVTPAVTQKRMSNVPLTFTHAFALIQLNIKMGILQLVNPYYLNQITIRGGNTGGGNYGIVNNTSNPAQVAYDLTTRRVWAATNDAQSYAQSFTSAIPGISLTTTSITLYAFVLPGSYSNPEPSISFKITTLGILKTTSFSKFSNTTFQAGTKYVYDVAIGLSTRTADSDVTIVTREIIPCDTHTTELFNQ